MHLATGLETRISFIHKDDLVTVLANTQKCPGTVTMRLNIQMSIMAIFPTANCLTVKCFHSDCV
jgi:hypothetical protein